MELSSWPLQRSSVEQNGRAELCIQNGTPYGCSHPLLVRHNDTHRKTVAGVQGRNAGKKPYTGKSWCRYIPLLIITMNFFYSVNKISSCTWPFFKYQKLLVLETIYFIVSMYLKCDFFLHKLFLCASQALCDFNKCFCDKNINFTSILHERLLLGYVLPLRRISRRISKGN